MDYDFLWIDKWINYIESLYHWNLFLQVLFIILLIIIVIKIYSLRRDIEKLQTDLDFLISRIIHNERKN